MSKAPVTVNQTYFGLANIGTQADAFKITKIGFQSERGIGVSDNGPDGKKRYTFVDFQNNFNLMRKANPSDGGLPHPTSNIVAFRAKSNDGKLIVQVFDLGQQKKLKNVRVVGRFSYWRWVNNTTLGLITNDAIYHLDTTKAADQVDKVLDRRGNMVGCQVISYGLDPQGKFATISGISTKDKVTIDGNTQLCLIQQGKQQSLQAYYGIFGNVKIRNDSPPATLYAYCERPHGSTTNTLKISEISAPPAGEKKFKIEASMAYPSGSEKDFPVFMSFDEKHGVIFIVTKGGIFFMYEVSTGAKILASKISTTSVITGASNTKTGGIFLFNAQGNVIPVDTEPKKLIDFIKSNPGIPNASNVAMNLAIRNGLPGAEQHFLERFNTFMMNQQYKEAAQVVANSPGDLLRNKDTIEKFRNLPKQPGKPYPLIQYFFVLLETSKFNDIESLEICGVVLGQNKKQFVQDWINRDKLTFTEALGDLVKPHDAGLAAQIYEKAGSQKAVQAKIESGDIQGAMALGQTLGGGGIDFLGTLRASVVTNPQQALIMAKQLTKAGSVQANKVAEIFMTANRPNELTNYCIECMTQNLPQDAQWQTMVLEICLRSNPSMAENIFASGKWTHYDKQKLGPLCEQKGLLSRALECYSNIEDIKRVVLNTQMFQPQFLINYIGDLRAEDCIACLTDLIRHNRQNTELVVKIASANFDKLGVAPVVKLLESVSAFDGIYFFLGAILPNTQDHEIYFKYIEACVKCNRLTDVERVIREAKECYDPIRIKDFLLKNKLPDPKPLIFLCDQNGYVDELTRYLWENGFKKHIEVYIFQVNTNASPAVLGTLIDLEAEENYIKQLLYNLRGSCPPDQLIEEFTKRNKLRVLEAWLEQRAAEGNTTTSIHNALAQIFISTDNDPKKFLEDNTHYDSKVVGKLCEETDPHLAYIAYKRDFGNCDYELIELTNKNALYRLQAKYLVERKDKDLWAHVLTPDNPHRQYIIDQVVSSALPETKDVDQVSVAVQSFITAELDHELISLLEKLVLRSSEFSGIKQLQNLLIITAIKNDKERVMDYIHRLDNFDGMNIANIARGEDYKLYEEAFVIYKKIDEHVEAINMLIYYIESLERAADYAEKVNLPDVWSVLGKAYLTKFMIIESIDAFIKANDGTHFMDIISAAQNEEKWEELIKFLIMARETKKDSYIDSELLFSYAKLNQLPEIEAFISDPNSADIQRVGEKCFDTKLYDAAIIFFKKIKSNAKIASCLVHLGQYPQAIEAARKANNTRTWKEIALTCIAVGEYKLAAVAGQNIIIHPDHLDELVKQYEKYDVPEEMISLLESCLGVERSHIGIYTVLGILYAKYKSNKLMDYIRAYFKKLNVTKLLRVCERYFLWNEVVYLYNNYDEQDNAIKTMITHSPTAFKHELFIQIIQNVNNSSVFYDAISFYLEEEPKLLNELLRVITNKVDLSKVVSQVRRAGYLPIIVEWLQGVQNQNNQAVNDALNALYLEIEDFDALRESIATYQSIDAISLAKEIEGHDNAEFRRISALIFRKNKKYEKSINISKGDKQYRDAIETAQESRNPKLADGLLQFFAEQREKEFFTVCTYTCYELIKPDRVMELAWRHGMTDFAMPFFIQMVSELKTKVETVERKHEEREKKEEKKKEEESKKALDIANPYIGGGVTNSPYPMLMGEGMNPPGMTGGMGAGLGGGLGGSMGGLGGTMGGSTMGGSSMGMGGLGGSMGMGMGGLGGM